MNDFRASGAGGKQPARAVSFCARRAQGGVQRGSAASGPTPCGDAAKGGYSLSQKENIPLTPPRERTRGEPPRPPTLQVWGLKSCAACGIRCGVHGFAMNPYVSLRLATAPYYREARVTVARRQTACRMRHCCARRIVETGGRRELVRTATRLAERQRIVGAEANRLAMLTRLRRTRGTFTSETSELFKPETANLSLSLGVPKGIFSFRGKRISPLIASLHGAGINVQRLRRCFPRGTSAAKRFAPVRNR